jgi:hypothetical protein
MKAVALAITAILILGIWIGIAYLGTGAGHDDAGSAIGGLAITPALVLFLGVPLTILLLSALLLLRNRR